MIYKTFLRPFFFLFQPESVHGFVMFWMKMPPVRWVFRLLFDFQQNSLD